MINASIVLLLFIICCFCSIGSFKSKKRQLISYTIISIIILIFVAFRDGNSLNDYSNYINLYNTNRIGEVEPSFYLIRDITQHLGGIITLFFIYAFLGVSFKIIAIYKITDLLFLTLIIYISNIMILHDMTQIRAGVTSGIFLFSIPYLATQEKLKYCICCAVAIFFHSSGILLLLPTLFWFSTIRNSEKLIFLLIPIGYLLGNTVLNLNNIPIESIRIKLEMYKSLQASNSAGLKDLNIFNPYILFRIAMFYILLWKGNIIQKHNPYFKPLIFVEAIGLFIFPVFSSIAILGYRGSELIGVVEILLYPMLYYVIRPNLFGKLIVILIGALLLVVNLTYKHLIYI